MRIVAVNHLHPRTRHVGAVRVTRFAEALAARGHHVVLLTGPLPDVEAPDDVDAVAKHLAEHNWARPFHLACPLRSSPMLTAAREGRLVRPLRRMVLAGHYLVSGGVFGDWREGSRRFWPLLAEVFRPNVTWGTFGNTDAWIIARGIAHLSGCPWVMDIKDSWDAFVPAPMSALVARRFTDAAACTALSRGLLDRSGRHFPSPKAVVYSGVPAAQLTPPPPSVPFRIVVTGSTYGRMSEIADAVGRFLDRFPVGRQEGIIFTYAGGEYEAAGRLAGSLAGRCGLDIRSFVDLPDLAGLQRQAFLNVYGRATGQPDFFHHKLFELLCADRPIACLPAETEEAVDIAAGVGGEFHSCADSGSLAAALERAWRDRRPEGVGVNRDVLARYAWEAQAGMLETILASAGAGR